MSPRYVIEADGGSRGNPGPSGSGAVIIDAETGEILREISEYIGIATNNVAEYRAVLAALKALGDLPPADAITVRMDSKLVIEQLSGGWKIKHPDMRILAAQVQAIAQALPINYQWIPREQNSKADALANLAMDSRRNLEPALVEQVSVESPAMVKEFNRKLPSSVRAPGHVTQAPTTVILVRHGRTHLTESAKISGRGGENPPLSDLGREDATRVARLLAEFGKTGAYAHMDSPDAIITSPILRTRETASIIAERLGLSDVAIEDNIAEISFGTWDGKSNDEAKALDPELFEGWRGSWTVSPPDGESLETFDARIAEAQKGLVKKYAGRTVVVVAHVMPIRGLIGKVLGTPPSVYWSLQVAPCSVSVVRYWGSEAAEIITVNSTAHLG
ncbi:MAG: bifunctional RNase H/acid phosphatase [Microbacteriaceae bacterium]